MPLYRRRIVGILQPCGTKSFSPWLELAHPVADLSWIIHLERSETEPKTELIFKQGSLSKVCGFNSLLALLCLLEWTY